MIKIVSLLQAMGESDQKYTKKEKEHFIVGKNDKKIGVMSEDGELDILTQLPVFTIKKDSSYPYGNIKFPTDEGEFMIAWGQVQVSADTTSTHDFHFPFQNECVSITGSHVENDALTSLMIKSLSESQFQIQIIGGNGSEVVSWVAMGH